MQKAAVTEDWQKSIGQLAQRVAARRLTQEEIAQATGVDQSQVSRILTGQAKRRSRNVERLCRYARGLVSASPSAVSHRQHIEQAVDTLWDGSARHARAIADALDAIARVQQAFAGDGKKK
jgi:transcriptional regulator with XRE-family HTH domain